jgi:copper chaperone CopZ
MERLTLILPALYGDHHVAPVRRALERLEGVSDISISPAAHEVRLRFDPARQSPSSVEKALAGVGYVTGDPERALPSAGPAAPRHSAMTAETMVFAHETPAWEGRPLWPCPGFDIPAIPEN